MEQWMMDGWMEKWMGLYRKLFAQCFPRLRYLKGCSSIIQLKDTTTYCNLFSSAKQFASHQQMVFF